MLKIYCTDKIKIKIICFSNSDEKKGSSLVQGWDLQTHIFQPSYQIRLSFFNFDINLEFVDFT